MVGGGCERLMMVMGGGGVVLWSLWLSAFVGCCCSLLWAVVVICRCSLPCVRCFLCEKRREGGGVLLLTSVFVIPLLSLMIIHYWLPCR